MTDVEQVKIESDERGFELHLIVDDDIEVSPEGRVVLNIQRVVFDLFGEVAMEIAPYVAEARAARREFDSGVADDPNMQGVLDSIRDAGAEDAAADRILEAVDQARKAERENR